MMNCRNFLVLTGILGLAACGDASGTSHAKRPAVEPVASTEALVPYDAQGVVSSLDGQILTLDHDGASAAGLKPGRDRFIVYADTLAEAPITPGSRVKFQFKKTRSGLEVSRLEARP